MVFFNNKTKTKDAAGIALDVEEEVEVSISFANMLPCTLAEFLDEAGLVPGGVLDEEEIAENLDYVRYLYTTTLKLVIMALTHQDSLEKTVPTFKKEQAYTLLDEVIAKLKSLDGINDNN